MTALIIGTRGSDLALAQTRIVSNLLRETQPELNIQEKVIHTTGDMRLDIALSDPGPLDKGLFTKELEYALLERSIDVAVHSLKDLPVEMPAGLALGAVLERENPDDVLISKHPDGLAGLPAGSTVATGSLRRRHFLLLKRPDLNVVELRGNIPTRIRKLREQHGMEAIVLAAAGLRRLSVAGCPLGLDNLHQSPLDFMLPAPGQGAVAVQCRADDQDVITTLRPMHHLSSAVVVSAERAVLSGLGGGCHMPLGVRAIIENETIQLDAAWFHASKTTPCTASAHAHIHEWPSASVSIINQLYGQIK